MPDIPAVVNDVNFSCFFIPSALYSQQGLDRESVSFTASFPALQTLPALAAPTAGREGWGTSEGLHWPNRSPMQTDRREPGLMLSFHSVHEVEIKATHFLPCLSASKLESARTVNTGTGPCTLLFGCISPLEWGQIKTWTLQHVKTCIC